MKTRSMILLKSSVSALYVSLLKFPLIGRTNASRQSATTKEIKSHYKKLSRKLYALPDMSHSHVLIIPF